MKAQTLPVRNKGFALIVTLSLMILLTVIAVGLLSLSSITLRAAGQGEAMATAKANARLALMLALGDLQKTLGPDRAVTATSEILGTATAAPTKPNLTGVWKSWDNFDPTSTSTIDYVGEKTNRFQRWLVSSSNPADITARNFATAPWVGNTVELVGDGSLGPAVPVSAKVSAGLIPVSKGGKTQGSYAWHVADESVKARINSYRDPSKNATLAQKRALLAGHRPDVSVISNDLDFLPTDNATSGPDGKTASKNFELAKEVSNKITDFQQFDLLKGGTSATGGKSIGRIKKFRNDVTPYSLGVIVDVRNGGLKQDLSSIFEMSGGSTISLPTEFAGKKLYQSTLGSTFTPGLGYADPYWSNLAGYYNSFRNISASSLETNPTLIPPDSVVSVTSEKVPKIFLPGPVIAKVETIFSLVTREDNSTWMNDINTWANWTKPIRKKTAYAVNLIFSPQITLHNPYNVRISFNRMKVTLNNVPVAFNFSLLRNGAGLPESQSVTPGKFECLNQMIENTGEIDPSTSQKVNQNRKFVVHLGDWSNTDPYNNSVSSTQATVGDIVMDPGQTLVFCPWLPENLTFDTDSHVNTDNTTSPVVFFDYNSKITSRGIKAKAGIRPGMGFELNTITPSHRTGKALTSELSTSDLGPSGTNGGTGDGFWWFLLRDNSSGNTVPGETNSAVDKYFVEYKIQRPSYWVSTVNMEGTLPVEVSPNFEVSATIRTKATGVDVNYAKLLFNYGNDANLKKFFGDRTYRYPPVGSLFGKTSDDTTGAFVSQATALGSQSNTKPFAIFSAYARTTNGGVYETGFREKKGTETPDVNLLRDGRLAGKPFLFHNPSRAVVTMDLATNIPSVQPYELNLQPFLSRGDYDDDLEIDARNRVLAVTGNTAGRGIKSGSYLEIPTGPMQTIADFRRSNVLASSYLPHFTQPVGNSLLHPLMSSNKVIENDLSIPPNIMLDQSVLVNQALYDRFYFSTFATNGLSEPATEFERFMDGIAPLRLPLPLLSQAFQPFWPQGKTTEIAKAELFTGSKPNNTGSDPAYKIAAEYQMIRGPFNVNSTSVEAWKAVLSAMKRSDIAVFWAKNAEVQDRTSAAIPILGMSLPNGGKVGEVGPSNLIDDEKTNDWNGYREINEAQMTTLATEIVKQVRTRGPFLSMSEFVNRQIGPQSPLSLSGALEQAINDSGINNSFLGGSITDLTPASFDNPPAPALPLYNYKTTAATIGNPAAGAPGWVSQGDLLRILEPAATVRSDTFVIRVCGQAQDAGGNITARAYAEAVVQRTPEYVDSTNRPSFNIYSDPRPSVNKTFGRRINLVSFRWLSSNEV